MSFLETFQLNMSYGQWLVHAAIILINVGLFFLAKPIVQIMESGRDLGAKIRIFRVLNILFFTFHFLDLILLGFNSNYEHYFIRIGSTLAIIYAGLFAFSACSYFSRKKFGVEKQVDDKCIYIDTYSSRIVDIVFLIIVIITTVYLLIKLWGADSLLETTGIIGILAAFLAFTSNVWAPDIISGLIILNTQMLEDGVVVVIDGYPDEYIINKVSFIYTTLYDVRNNHRTLIRNNRFIQSKIDNLSRIASSDGIRQKLIYNIGYPKIDSPDAKERLNALEEFKQRVDKMFERAFKASKRSEDIKVNKNKRFEWLLTNTADFSLEYTLFVYLERLPNTKITATVRKHLMGTMYRVNEEVYTASIVEGLDLSTPVLSHIQVAGSDEL